MALVQSVEYALADRVDGGISKANLDAALVGTAGALDWLRARHADGKLPLLRLPEKTSDLDEIKQAGTRLRAGASDIVLLGTGGSSLGGQTLAQLAGIAVRGKIGRASCRERVCLLV